MMSLNGMESQHDSKRGPLVEAEVIVKQLSYRIPLDVTTNKTDHDVFISRPRIVISLY